MATGNCKLTRFVVILGDKFSCLLLFGVIIYSVKPITSSQLSCFEVSWALENTKYYVVMILKDQQQIEPTINVHRGNPKSHCLDKLLDEAIIQAEIYLLKICQQLKRKSTFLVSHRLSDFHVFDEKSKHSSSQLASHQDTFSNFNLHYHSSWFIAFLKVFLTGCKRSCKKVCKTICTVVYWVRWIGWVSVTLCASLHGTKSVIGLLKDKNCACFCRFLHSSGNVT